EEPEINENITGGTMGLGAISAKLWDTTLSLKGGVEGITYKKTPRVDGTGLTKKEKDDLQIILDKRFTSGAFLWVGGYAFKDYRNHPIHPSRGYQYAMFTKFAIHSNLKDNPNDTPTQNAE